MVGKEDRDDLSLPLSLSLPSLLNRTLDNEGFSPKSGNVTKLVSLNNTSVFGGISVWLQKIFL